MEYSAYASTSSMHYSAHVPQQDQQSHENQQFWEPHPAAAGFCSSNSDTPIFTNPFDLKPSLDAVHVAQPEGFFSSNFELPYAQQAAYEAAHHPEFFVSPPQQQQPLYSYVEPIQPQHMAHAQHGYYAPSPTLSDLSSLSSSGTNGSPFSPPHLLTPVSPAHHGHAHFTPPSPVISAQPMMLPPRPLDMSMSSASTSTLLPPSPSLSASSSHLSDSSTPPSTTTIAPSTTSTGPADGQYAVLTLTGHTIAASGSYKDVLSAARSVRKANESGLVDDSRTCAYCGKVCDRPSTLKTHLNSHTGARPHTCSTPGCGRQFTVLSNMYRHAKVCAAQRARDVRRAAAAAAALRR